jgi:hypothetical protein
VSQQDERPWTDYVRIATPIVGLLVLLAVFWFWANSLIGETSDDPPPTKAAAEVTVITENTPTPSPTEDVELPAETPQPTGEATQENTNGDEETPESDNPTETPEETDNGNGDTLFEEGETVVLNDNDVRLREEPTTDSTALGTYNQGTEFVILSTETEEANGFTWWNVKTADDSAEGWMAEQFLDPKE